MQTEAIKPGLKPKKEDGTPDKRRRVNPENRLKHPKLKLHKHKPGNQKIDMVKYRIFGVWKESINQITHYTFHKINGQTISRASNSSTQHKLIIWPYVN